MNSGKLTWPDVQPVEGIRLGVASAGIKKPGRNDIVLFEIDEGACTAGVFTQNAFAAAPVTVGREHLKRGGIRYFLINSGNANACTGSKGLDDALACCNAVASKAAVCDQQVIPFSTGVIGEFLPVEKIISALPQAFADLKSDGWHGAAQAIMTTDTQPKGACAQFDYDGERITVSGIAKGAGMIRPNMATMLAFVATDAVVAQPVLDILVKHAADQSFNRISIDGDTSTNDACLLVATGRSGLPMINEAAGDLFRKLQAAVVEVMQALAQSIIRDGEGATKFVTVEVHGGHTPQECLKVAYAIAHSPLVKTALYASDANWGRIVAAIGYAGLPKLDPVLIQLWLDDVLVVEGGCRSATYTEAEGAAVIAKGEFVLKVGLGRGNSSERIWTCDLSHDYVSINADYRS